MKRSRTETADFVISQIKQLGVRLMDSSRLGLMQRRMSRLDVVQADDPDYELVLEAERDMTHLAFFFDHWDRQHADQLVEILKRVVKDTPLPTAEDSNTAGRNFAAELFVAACCSRAGFHDVDFSEPDVTGRVLGNRYGFAVKRVKSLDKFRDRVSDAAKQLQRAGLPGMVDLDVTRMLNPDNIRIESPLSDHEFAARYFPDLNEFLYQRDQVIRDTVADRPVLGLIVHDHLVRRDVPGTMTMTIGMNLGQTKVERFEFESVSGLYLSGLPDRQALNADAPPC